MTCFMIWKCEVHIWTRGCLASLHDIKVVFILILSLIFQNRWSPHNLQLFPQSDNLQKFPISGRDQGNFFRMTVS